MNVGLRRIGALVGGVAITTAIACQLAVPLKVEPEAPRADAADAGSPIATLVACTDPKQMLPPATGQGGDITATFAFGTLSMGNDGGVDLCATPGVDLDGLSTCIGDAGEQVLPTCPPDNPRCHWGPSCGTGSRNTTCDEVGGIDNALGAVLRSALFDSIPNFDRRQVDPNVVLRTGVANVLIRLSGYNGQPNDPEVTVAFFVSSGLDETTTPMLQEGVEAGPDYLRERWDGKSRRTWFVDPSSLSTIGTYASRFVTDGFVRDGVLVVAASTLVVPFGLSLTIRDARLVGDLRKAGDDWVIVRGMISGRFTVADVMRGLDPFQFYAGSSTQTLCSSELLRSQVVGLFCKAADLSSDGGACDSLSAGITFHAVPATIGLVREPQLSGLRGECPDASTSCEGVGL